MNADMFAAAQKMMSSLSPEQLAQMASLASNMDPSLMSSMADMTGMPAPSQEQMRLAAERLKRTSPDELKRMAGMNQPNGGPAPSSMHGNMNGPKVEEVLSDADSELLKNASALKDAGVALFKGNNYKDAAVRFEEALDETSKIEEGSSDTVEQLEQSLHLNAAFSHLKCEAYLKCTEHCDWVLRRWPTNVKALYRKGLAISRGGERFEGARLLGKALEASGGTDTTIRTEYEGLVQDLSEEEKVALSKSVSSQIPIELKTGSAPDAGASAPKAGGSANKTGGSASFPTSATSAAAGAASAKMFDNPQAAADLSKIIGQMDDKLLSDAMGQMGGSGMDPQALKQMVSNPDLMKSVAEVMKAMTPEQMQAISQASGMMKGAGGLGAAGGLAGAAGLAGSGGIGASQNQGGPMPPPIDPASFATPETLKTLENALDAIPDETLENLVKSQTAGLSATGTEGTSSGAAAASSSWLASQAQLLSGKRLKWIIKKLLFAARTVLRVRNFYVSNRVAILASFGTLIASYVTYTTYVYVSSWMAVREEEL